MKNVAKVVVMALVLAPIALLGGCAKKCCPEKPRPCHVEKMKEECGGK